MAALTIQDVSRRSGLIEPTLRYYGQVGLIGPIERDESSGHHRYRLELAGRAESDRPGLLLVGRPGERRDRGSNLAL